MAKRFLVFAFVSLIAGAIPVQPQTLRKRPLDGYARERYLSRQDGRSVHFAAGLSHCEPRIGIPRCPHSPAERFHSKHNCYGLAETANRGSSRSAIISGATSAGRTACGTPQLAGGPGPQRFDPVIQSAVAP